MNITLGAVGIFTVGMLVQLFLLLNLTEVTKQIIAKIAGTLLLSALLAAYLSAEFELASLTGYLIIYCFCASTMMAWTFRDRIVPIINEATLVLINLVAMYLVIRQGYEWPFVVILGLLTAGSVINAIVPKIPSQQQKIMLFVWYFVLSLLIAISQLQVPMLIHLVFLIIVLIIMFGALFIFNEIKNPRPGAKHAVLRGLGHLIILIIIAYVIFIYSSIVGFAETEREFSLFAQNNNFSLTGLFTLGMSFGLALANITYIGGLIPFQGKKETRATAVERVKEHMDFLISRYNDSQLNLQYGVLLILLIAGILLLNVYFNAVSDTTVTAIALLISAGANYLLFKKSKAGIKITS